MATGCASDDDPTLFLTGDEEFAVLNADGEYECENPKKELVCHIPPGNPDNAHTICIGIPAVAAHQAHHGDPVGACDDGEGDGDGDGDDGGDGDGDDGGDGDGDGGDGDGDGDGDIPPVD
jgi:hypothetical protein